MPLNFKLCILCQLKDNFPLLCPALKRGKGYETLAANLIKFKELGGLSVNVDLANFDEGDGVASFFLKHKVSWHKKCELKFSSLKLKRLQEKKEKEACSSSSEGIITRTSNSNSNSKNNPNTVSVCLFCELVSTKKEPLRKVQTLELDRKLRNYAQEISEKDVLRKISGGDLIAIEAEYHLKCLIAFYNKVKETRRKNSRNQSDKNSLLEGIALANVIEFIKDSRSEKSVFKLSELVKHYKNNLDQLGLHDIPVHSTRLKHRILSNIPDLVSKMEGRDIILIFEESLSEAIKLAGFKDSDKEGLILTEAAKILRKHILEHHLSFEGKFDETCNEDSVPQTLFQFTNMLLTGSLETPSIKKILQPVLSTAQIIVFNTIARPRRSSVCAIRHNRIREPPLSIYLALKIHAETRKRQLVETMHTMGLCISYKRLLTITSQLANSISKHYEEQGLVCPPYLRKNVFTTASVDNIDHNPSSTSAKDSFHGTAITLHQHLTTESPGQMIPPIAIDFTNNSNTIKPLLETYAVVPLASQLRNNIKVPPIQDDIILNFDTNIVSVEQPWLEEIQKDYNDSSESAKDISWAAFHASKCVHPVSKSKVALLPLFNENAHSVSMILHTIHLVLKATNYYNKNQTPVLCMDQPLFAIGRQILFTSNAMSENSIVLMMGGLHIEMAAWAAIGNLLQGSGWDGIIAESGVTTSGRAQSFLQASHLSRTRRIHQVTAASLYVLMHNAYSNSSRKKHFSEWRQKMSKDSPQFQFWNEILNFEITILFFIRSIREGNFSNYITSLKELLPWIFALDRTNYARWLSVHFRDMITLKERHPDVFHAFATGGFVVNKTTNAFSSIALDHAHEQENANIKGDGGAVGLTENPAALRRWMLAGPEISRLIGEYESDLVDDVSLDFLGFHHEQTFSKQAAFRKDVSSIVKAISDAGNPFADDSDVLYALDTKDAVCNSVKLYLYTFYKTGKKQFEDFFLERFVSGSKSINDPIPKNGYKFFKAPKIKNKTQNKQAGLKNDLSLFSRLYIACQSRQGDLDSFFKHENQLWPPALSTFGEMRHCNKSDLLQCLEADIISDVSQTDCIILDGAAIVNILIPKTCKNFQEYMDTVFAPYIISQLRERKRLDVVWDVYSENSIKQQTRNSRGIGQRKLVAPTAPLPKNWSTFLRVAENKRELFSMLANYVINIEAPEKIIISTLKDSSISNTKQTSTLISKCNQEEADTRIFVHVLDAFESGLKKILIRTVDTDVVVLAIFISNKLPSIEIWLAFGTGQHFRYIPAHLIAQKLGHKSLGLPFFHALTGCDTVSSFSGQGKKSAWDAWQSFSNATETFAKLTTSPAPPSDDQLKIIQGFIVVLYDKSSSCTTIDELRKYLFTKKSRNIENIPPTEAALKQHILRAIYQGGCLWGNCLAPIHTESPIHWGWKIDNDCLIPHWTDLKDASQSCQELIKCACKNCGSRCKCNKYNLKCTELCKCDRLCDRENESDN